MSKHKQPVSALKLLPQGVLAGSQSREIPGQIYQGFSKVLYTCYQTEIPFFKPMGGQLWAPTSWCGWGGAFVVCRICRGPPTIYSYSPCPTLSIRKLLKVLASVSWGKVGHVVTCGQETHVAKLNPAKPSHGALLQTLSCCHTQYPGLEHHLHRAKS